MTAASWCAAHDVCEMQEERERPYKNMELRLTAYRQECEARLQRELQLQVSQTLLLHVKVMAIPCAHVATHCNALHAHAKMTCSCLTLGVEAHASSYGLEQPSRRQHTSDTDHKKESYKQSADRTRQNQVVGFSGVPLAEGRLESCLFYNVS